MVFKIFFSNLLILLIPISSFLVFPSLQGSTPAALVIAIIFATSIYLDFSVFKKIIKFILIFIVYYAISQIILFYNSGYDINLVEYSIDYDGNHIEDTILISNDNNYIFRFSSATQFLYLLVGYILFVFFRKNFDSKYNKIIFFSSYFLFLYGIYLFFYYLITGECSDPLSNRAFGNFSELLSECSYGYQTININGIELHRIKSFTGEPSMYVLTALPYTLFAYFNKKYMLFLMGLISLILTFSTTFYIIFSLLFVLIIFIRFNFFQSIIFLIIGLLVGFAIINNELFNLFIYNKFNLSSLSGIQRFSAFVTSLNFFESLPFLSQIFGIGFGTIRSSDLFSTFLVNIGVLGVTIYMYFFLKPIFFKNSSLEFIAIKFCILSELLVLLTSVPEFSYLTSWFFLGLAYSLMDKNINLKREA